MDISKKIRTGLLSVFALLSMLIVVLLFALDGYDSLYTPIAIAVLVVICAVLMVLIIIVMNHVNSNSSYSEIDQLTGLPKYKAFQRKVARIIAKDPKGEYVIAISKIRFLRVFNATYGTVEGDNVIRALGSFVRRRMAEHPEVVAAGYFSADNVFTCWKAKDIDYEFVYADYAEELRKLYPWFDFKPCVSFAYVNGASKDVGVCCDNAMYALSMISEDIEQNYIVFDDSMNRKLLTEHQITLSMQKALDNGEFVPYLQPQYNYETGAMIGAEVLVRWIKPDGTIVSPADFIPLFERNGFIYELDKYIWECACKLLRKWKNEGFGINTLSVNVSRRDIYHNSFIKTLQNMVWEYGVKPSQLHLEVTESAYSENPKQLVSTLSALRRLGFVVEMDDFGSGYSSLNALRGMPVDTIKLDSVFLKKGDWGDRTGKILASVVRMAHMIDLRVIVEGVETKVDADFMKSIGCLRMQGYYFARPMPQTSFEEIMRTSSFLNLPDRSDDEQFGEVDFFNINSQSALLFNSFVGGAAIISQEKDDSNMVSALRMNDKFYEIMGLNREQYLERQYDMLAGLTPETAKGFLSMLDHAWKTEAEDSCITCSIDREGYTEPLWCFCRVRFLSAKVGTKLFYLSVENVTDKVKLQERNNRLAADIEEREDLFMHAANMTDMYYWKYDIPTRVMHSCFRCQQNLGLPETIPNYPEPLIERGIMSEDQRIPYLEFLERVRSGEEGISFNALLTKDKRPYVIRYSVERDFTGKPAVAYGLALPRDVQN